MAHYPSDSKILASTSIKRIILDKGLIFYADQYISEIQCEESLLKDPE